MFAENDKISLRQFNRLLIFDLFSVSGIVIPNIAAGAAGRDGLLSICLGTLYAFLYGYVILYLCRQTGGRYLNFCDDNFGKFVTFFVGIPYIIKLFFCLVFSARLFGQIINQTLLADTDNRIIILFLLIVSAYAASKGLEVRARITEVIFFLVIVPVFLFLLLGLRKVDPGNLTPLFTESFTDIGFGSYQILIAYSALELMIFSIPLIHFRQGDIKRGKKLYSYVAKALTITGILNILMYIVTMGMLGRIETGGKLWSAIYTFQMVRLPGGFLQRQDAFILSIWLLGIFTLTGALFYYLSYITGHITKLSNRNYLLVPFILLVFGASVIPIETEQFFMYFKKYMMYIGMPQSIIIPVLVAGTGKLKKFINRKVVANTILILFISIAGFTLTGCSDMTEIEDRNFIQAIGIDVLGEDMIEVYYILPDLKALTEQGAEDPKKLTLNFKNKDFSEIEEDYGRENNKRLDFSQLKTIILGEGITKNKELMSSFLSYVENKYEIGRNTLVFLSDSTGKNIIELNGDVEGGIGDYLSQLSRVNLRNNGIEEIDIGDLILARNEGDLSVIIPVLKNSDKKVVVSGLGIFSEGTINYLANEKVSDFIYYASGFGKNKILYLPPDEKEGPPKYVIKINRLIRSMEFYEEAGKPYLSMLVEGYASIQKGAQQQQDERKSDTIERIEEECNSYVRENIGTAIKSISLGNGIDFINLYRMTGYRDRSIWLNYRDKQKEFLKDLTVNLTVDFHIQ